MLFWSDKNIKAGEWEKQIESAMQGAVAAVLLVSDTSSPRTTSSKKIALPAAR